jgi:hypothetical protein
MDMGLLLCWLGRNVTPRRPWNPSRPDLSVWDTRSLSTLLLHCCILRGCRSLRIYRRIFAFRLGMIPWLALFLHRLPRRRFGACSFAWLFFLDKFGIHHQFSLGVAEETWSIYPSPQHQHCCKFHVIKVTLSPAVRPCLECAGSVRRNYCFRISV